jgi:hypothetical protein
MRKKLLAAAFFFLPTIAAWGQNFTTVTATITDPNGLPYANASVTAGIVPSGTNPSVPPPCSGQTSTNCAIAGLTRATADVAGKFTMNLASNAAILPSGTQWQFTINETGIAPPAGTGPQSCVFTSTGTLISGASVSLSAQISATCPALSLIVGGGGGGGVCGADTEIQFNNAGVCGFSPNLIYNTATKSFQSEGGAASDSFITAGTAHANGFETTAVTALLVADELGATAVVEASGDVLIRSKTGEIKNGEAAISSGQTDYIGVTSGSADLGVADVAGNPARINLPTATAAVGTFLQSDGGTPQQLSWGTPAGFISDSFARANENPIKAPWVVRGGGAYTLGQILGNQYEGQTGLITDMVYDGGISWPYDQYSQAKLMTFTTGAGYAVLCLECQSASANGYAIVIDGVAGGPPFAFNVFRNGVLVFQGSSLVTFTSGDVYTAKMVGGTITAYQNNKILLSYTDSSPLPLGKPGIAASPSFGVAGDIAWINWSGGPAVGDTASVLTLPGATSGIATIGAAAVAGNPARINVPIATGAAGTFLKTDGGNPQQLSWDTPAGAGTVTHTAGNLTANALVLGNAVADITVLPSIGTTTTVLHGNAAGAPGFAAVTNADTTGTFPATAHNLLSTTHGDTTASAAVRGGGIFAIGASPTWTQVAHSATTGGYFKWNGTDMVASTGAASGTGTPTACTNQFVTGFTLATDAAPTSSCTTATLASAQFANQGTTTTVLHGNAAGNPSFAAVSLSAEVTGTLPVGNAGLGVANPTIHSLLVAEGASPVNLVTSPATNGDYGCIFHVTSAVAVDPTCPQIGLSNRSVTGATSTDTILFSDNAARVDYLGSVAVAVTLPTATTLGNAAMVTRLVNNTTGSTTAVTVTPTTWTIDGASTLVIAQGQACTLTVDGSGTNWDADCAEPQLTAGANITFTRSANGLSIASSGGGSSAFPLTVSGTVTSGGIPYFSSTTVESSSALLATNGVVLGGGAGGAPTVTTADSTTTHALFATAGAPAFRALAAGDIPSAIPIGNVGSAGLSGTAPISIAATGAISITSPLPVANGGTALASGTSGGVLGYTAAGTLASSVALTVNVLPKGGGAGATPTNSLTTDDGTASTYTGTGGTKSPAFTSTGTTAGFVDFPQGTTSSAVAPCNTATSICEQAPTSVTSYLLTKPGAAPTQNLSVKATTTAGVQSWLPTVVSKVLTSNYTNATTTVSNVTGFSWAIDASTNYKLSCDLIYQASATTASLGLAFTGPASPTRVSYSTFQTETAANVAGTFFATSTDGTTFATVIGSTAVISTAVSMPATFTGVIQNGVNAGTLQIQAKAQGTGTVTIVQGSGCSLQGI